MAFKALTIKALVAEGLGWSRSGASSNASKSLIRSHCRACKKIGSKIRTLEFVSILIDYLLDQGVVMALEKGAKSLAGRVNQIISQIHGTLQWRYRFAFGQSFHAYRRSAKSFSIFHFEKKKNEMKLYEIP